MPEPQGSTQKRSLWQRSKARNLAKAIFWFIIGVIGVLVPIMPQVPFFVMSLLYLSLVDRRVHRSVRRFLRRHPKAEASYHRWRLKRRKKRIERRERKGAKALSRA